MLDKPNTLLNHSAILPIISAVSDHRRGSRMQKPIDSVPEPLKITSYRLPLGQRPSSTTFLSTSLLNKCCESVTAFLSVYGHGQMVHWNTIRHEPITTLRMSPFVVPRTQSHRLSEEHHVNTPHHSKTNVVEAEMKSNDLHRQHLG